VTKSAFASEAGIWDNWDKTLAGRASSRLPMQQRFDRMGTFSIWHWLIVGAIVLILFGGRGKVSELMGDVAKGIKSFRKGLADDDTKPVDPPKNDGAKT
jgi:sec-independent protein translocase protein TatA